MNDHHHHNNDDSEHEHVVTHALGFGSNFFRLFGDVEENDNDGDDDDSLRSDRGVVLRSLVPDDVPLSEVVSVRLGATVGATVTRDGRAYATGTAAGRRLLVAPLEHAFRVPLRVVQIAHGRRHALARFEGGRLVMSWGANHLGQLGTGDRGRACRTEPRPVEHLLRVGGVVTEIAAGAHHSAAVVDRSVIFGWGLDADDQCGGVSDDEDDYDPTVLSPTPVPGGGAAPGRAWKRLTLGAAHGAALTEDGRVYGWGSAASGRCGATPPGARTTGPRLILEKGIVDVAAGDAHTLALTDDGRVLAWGRADDGQTGTTPPGERPPRGVRAPTEVVCGNGDRPVRRVAAAGDWSAAVTVDGECYTWGYGAGGQLGHQRRTNKDKGEEEEATRSFESEYNAPRPRRLSSVTDGRGWSVREVVCGPANMILLCSDGTVGPQ